MSGLEFFIITSDVRVGQAGDHQAITTIHLPLGGRQGRRRILNILHTQRTIIGLSPNDLSLSALYSSPHMWRAFSIQNCIYELSSTGVAKIPGSSSLLLNPNPKSKFQNPNLLFPRFNTTNKKQKPFPSLPLFSFIFSLLHQSKQILVKPWKLKSQINLMKDSPFSCFCSS